MKISIIYHSVCGNTYLVAKTFLESLSNKGSKGSIYRVEDEGWKLQDDTPEIAKDTLTQVQLADRMNHKPNELSGGQRQRVAIARALVNKPSIVLADEPTGNLDSKTSIEIMGLLEEIHRQGNTIIMVTHEEDIALHAHRIIRMMDGRIESDEKNNNIVTVKDYQKVTA